MRLAKEQQLVHFHRPQIFHVPLLYGVRNPPTTTLQICDGAAIIYKNCSCGATKRVLGVTVFCDREKFTSISDPLSNHTDPKTLRMTFPILVLFLKEASESDFTDVSDLR